MDNFGRALNRHLTSLGDVETSSDVVMPCCGETFEGSENFFKDNDFKHHEIEDDVYYCPCCGMTVYKSFDSEIKTIAV